jgi:Methyltransferase domain
MQQFERRTSAPDQPLWIDLGCGTVKEPGFLGIDRWPMPGVDIVCDLDQGIPVASGSADYVLASHSLEHLRDLPAAISEIYRVCKDRALVTIIAPYDSTRLNRANPYHFQVWNEHTARFFTSDSSSPVDQDDFNFPSINEWGLSASDHSQSDVDLRCLRMEFQYFGPYRGLDEQTKRTLRQSLSDVCDQMALQLLVVKSPISQDELTRRAATIQYPMPAAFEARRRAEADVSAGNLFSELARTPARIAALSAKSNDEIGRLGDEIRRFIQRVDHLDRALSAEAQQSQRFLQHIEHIDRALVAETQDTRRALSELVTAGRTLSERMTAINSAMTRRMQATDDALRAQLAQQLAPVVEAQSGQRKLGEQILHHLVAERRARADLAFWPIRFLRRYRQRGVDLRASAGGELPRLWQGPEAPGAGFRLQPGTFLQANVPRVYRISAGSPLRGIEIGVSAMFPLHEPSAIADFALLDSLGTLLRTGSVTLDKSCGSVPASIAFEPLLCESGQSLVLKLVPRENVERIGVQLFEWHRITHILRRVPELRLAYRGLY